MSGDELPEEWRRGMGKHVGMTITRAAGGVDGLGRGQKVLVLGAVFALMLVSWARPASAVSCLTQSSIAGPDRDLILAAANPVGAAVATGSVDQLQGMLLPAASGDWDGIRAAAQADKPLFQGGALAWRTSYLLDATDLKATGDTEFFCTNTDSSVTVTINLRNLPPGRYALLIGDYAGAALAGQLGLLLGQDATQNNRWKLGGIFAREGALGGHDGIWYWTRARDEARQKESWSAFFSYEVARNLLLPMDFLSSPNLDKLNAEEQQLKSPVESLPLSVAGTGAFTGMAWKITAARLDTSLHEADLAITYEGTGVADPVAARQEAVGVMTGLLRSHPDLRESFHGLWAYAMKDIPQ